MDAGAPSAGKFTPIEASKAVFWDRQTTETAQLLRDIAEEFNSTFGGLPIEIEQTGNYADVFRKVTTSIQARKLPAMAVSYESMTVEYIPTGAVLPLDNFLKDPATGYTDEELADFFPAVLDTNRYSEFEGKLYSFPFAKSVLMLYFNKAVLAEAGLTAPPQTWDEFVAQCRTISEKTGKPGYAAAIDASTINGFVFSMGGEVVSGRKTLYDSAESIAAFEMLELLIKEKLAYQITPGTFDDQVAMVAGKVAFTIRTSSSRENVRLNFNGYDGWGMAAIPQKDPSKPATVLFGPNINIFDTTPDQARAAWEFTTFFMQPEINVRWALGTGYLPIRKSAANDPKMQAFFQSWEHARAPFDSLAFAKPEPNISGWQEVRTLIERAETAVLSGVQSGRDAALQLKRDADAALARQH